MQVAKSTEPNPAMRFEVDGGDEDLSEDAITALLCEAENRIRAQGTQVAPSSSSDPSSSTSSSSSSATHPGTATSLPKLNPGNLPNPYISTNRNISRTTPNAYVVSADTSFDARNITDSVVVKKKLKNDEAEATAGSKWYDMPRTELTTSVKRDLRLLAMRGVLDPKRHYKQNVLKGFPAFSQMGTVIEGNTEFFSSRLTRKERKQTILDEIVSSHETTQRFKRKHAEIDQKKRAGKKRFYKAKMEKRRKF